MWYFQLAVWPSYCYYSVVDNGALCVYICYIKKLTFLATVVVVNLLPVEVFTEW